MRTGQKTEREREMKKTKWLTFILVLMLAAVFVVGCPEDDDDDSNPVGPGAGDISGDEMTEAQMTEVAEDAMAANAQASIQTAFGMRQAFMGGSLFSANPINPEIIKNYTILADPPEGWTGPDADGWYTETGVGEGEVFKIRITPDVWNEAHAGEDVTKIEYLMQMSYDAGGGVIDIIWSYWGEVNGDRTLLNGASEYSYDFILEIEGQNYGYESSVSYTWSDVSLVEGNYSGSFASSMLYPLVGDMGGFMMVAVTTQMDFIADGSGTGSGTIAGEEYVRFVFDAAANNQIAGHYTLKSEDWGTEHPITFWIH
jgi:hypothetical protein